jgi:hypothetical protein
MGRGSLLVQQISWTIHHLILMGRTSLMKPKSKIFPELLKMMKFSDYSSYRGGGPFGIDLTSLLARLRAGIWTSEMNARSNYLLIKQDKEPVFSDSMVSRLRSP